MGHDWFIWHVDFDPRFNDSSRLWHWRCTRCKVGAAIRSVGEEEPTRLNWPFFNNNFSCEFMQVEEVMGS